MVNSPLDLGQRYFTSTLSLSEFEKFLMPWAPLASSVLLTDRAITDELRGAIDVVSSLSGLSDEQLQQMLSTYRLLSILTRYLNSNGFAT